MCTAFLTGWTVGPGEALLVLLVILLLFGAKKLPELARALGKSMSEFKKGKEEGTTGKPDAKPEGEGCDKG